MEYVPYDELDGRPNIVVDGTGTSGTVLVLSHWVGAGTPDELADDLSTQIVFRYLDRPELRVDAGAVSNNHFDEDGLCGIYALVEPNEAMRHRDRLVDVASAGDFGTWADRDSARIAMTITAYADPDRSPLGPEPFAEPYPRQTAMLHRELLPLLPAMLDDVIPFASLWSDEDARLQRSLDAVATGTVAIDEIPEADLAIVRVGRQFGDEAPHEMAINNATERHRILTLVEGRPSLRYRYETWVRFRSRPTMPRVDLHALAKRLGESDQVAWTAGDVDDLTPMLAPTNVTSLESDVIERLVRDYLSEAGARSR